MGIQNKDLPSFSIVLKNTKANRWLVFFAALCLVLTTVLLFSLWYNSDSHTKILAEKLSVSEKLASDTQNELGLVKQQLANSKRSELISRLANNQIQKVLAEKDEQIAGLKADLSFYELLVGSSGRRYGLRVHNAEFEALTNDAWQYTITLTQNINRGGTTSGQMSLAIEGVLNGKLKTLSWQELTQNQQAQGQKFSFRYFQQLQGNAMLPKNFKPQRVKVTVKGTFGAIESEFNWLPKAHSNTIIQKQIKSE